MTTETHSGKQRRGRDIHEQHRVSTPLELLFDLTFVVAIALAAGQLHHGVMEHHLGQASLSFVQAFFAIWWAWMNYTWFASAYDDDSWTFRLLTMVQMVGVLIFAAGVPGIKDGDFRAIVLGYGVMRLALVVQWLLAARGDVKCRATCLRYAAGIMLVQACWIARLWLPVEWQLPSFALFALLELMVPPWAERKAHTPWHAHHIAERYGLLVIITLGECVLGATNSVASVWQSAGWSVDLAVVGIGSTTLVFALWWMYFLLPSGEALHHHRERSFVWGYGHFFLIATVAAMGSGLEVVADVLKSGMATPGAAIASVEASVHGAKEAHGVSALYAISLLACIQCVFMLSLWAIHAYATRARAAQGWLALVSVACVGLAPLAVWRGLPASWALMLLCVGPAIAIVYDEYGRRRRGELFAVR